MIRHGNAAMKPLPPPSDAAPRREEDRLYVDAGGWYLRERHCEPVGPFRTRGEAHRALELRMACWRHPWWAWLAGRLPGRARVLAALVGDPRDRGSRGSRLTG